MWRGRACFLLKGCKFNMPGLASFSSIPKVVLSLPLLSSPLLYKVFVDCGIFV